jgi:hypothetical protein
MSFPPFVFWREYTDGMEIVVVAAATAVTRERWEKQKEAWNSLHNGKKGLGAGNQRGRRLQQKY